MNIYSSFLHKILGIEISLYISRLRSFHLVAFSKDERRKLHHLAKNYVIICDTLYYRGIDSILRHYLTLEEVESVLNDCHSGACGSHLSGLATAQKKLREGYFWHSIFKDCIEEVKI